MAKKGKAVRIHQKPGSGKGGAGNEEIGPGGKGHPGEKRANKPVGPAAKA
jgi:hypothetical protein